MPSPSDDLVEALRALGFRGSREAIAALLVLAHKSHLGPTETLEQLVTLERRARDATNLARRTKVATLGSFKTLDRFDWGHPRQIDRALVEQLLGLDFIAGAENVLFRGQSGVGKTMLAQSLGHAALERGLTVRLSSLAAALADLLRQESLPALERRLRRYVRPDVLILDEVGYLPCDARAADLLYTIISRRHEQRSTIVTTNLTFKQWGTVFPGAACVVALVDRFNQHCHKVIIDADSWRETHSLGTGSDDDGKPPSPATKRPRRGR